ncbi:hypothetical protein ABT255_43090 [Streptomyces mirabilis]|uniref:hypothetical protein n=1 Tax=Streptomyces mirabilis TaxID=68239 RepID=UPI0033292440
MLRSPKTFVKDARRWQALAEGRVSPDSPVLAMMAWKPSSLFADGERHRRLRAAVRESIDRLDQHTLRRYVTRSADTLIDRFGPVGQADLMRDYSALLPLRVFIALAGFPSSYDDIVLAATAGVMNASGPDAARLSEEFLGRLYDLVAHKRRHPGTDLTSWLMAHEAGLTDDELVSELYLLIACACCSWTGASRETSTTGPWEWKKHSTRSCGSIRPWPTSACTTSCMTSASAVSSSPRGFPP